jgi:hypothetical protein
MEQNSRALLSQPNPLFACLDGSRRTFETVRICLVGCEPESFRWPFCFGQPSNCRLASMTGKWAGMSQRKAKMSRLSFEALLAAGHCPFYNFALYLRSSNGLYRVPAYMR